MNIYHCEGCFSARNLIRRNTSFENFKFVLVFNLSSTSNTIQSQNKCNIGKLDTDGHFVLVFGVFVVFGVSLDVVGSGTGTVSW